jgi:hypothetical protein
MGGGPNRPGCREPGAACGGPGRTWGLPPSGRGFGVLKGEGGILAFMVQVPGTPKH